MAIKNAANTVRFFVQDTATGLGVAGLTVAGNSFTSIKLSQDGTLGADIKADITLVDCGTGWYNFAGSAAQINYSCIAPVVVTATATYQAYGVTIYTEATGDSFAVVTNATYGNAAIRTRVDQVFVATGTPTSLPPTSATRVVGTNQGGTVADMAAHDDIAFATGEVVGSGLEVVVTRATSVTTEIPSLVRVTGNYDGSATHMINVYLWNYVLSAWAQIGTMLTRNTAFDYVFPLTIDNQDISTGEMKLRFLHNVTTYNAGHRLYLDWVSWEKVETNSAILSDLAAVRAKTDQLNFTLTNVNSQSNVTIAPSDMALDSTVAKETTVSGIPATTDALITASHGSGAYNAGGSAPTVAEIDTQLSGTHGSGAWGSGAAGIRTVTIITELASTTRVGGVRIAVYQGSTFVKNITTDSNGSGTTTLDDGTYEFRGFKTLYNVTTKTQTINEDETVTITCIASAEPSPAAGTQIMRISARDMGGVFDPSAKFTASVVGTNQNYSGVTVTQKSIAVVNVVGEYFELTLIIGAVCLIEGMSFAQTVMYGQITVTGAATSVPTDYPSLAS